MTRKLFFILILMVTVAMTGCGGGGGGGEAAVSADTPIGGQSDTPVPGPSTPAPADPGNAGDVTKSAELAWEPPVSNADGSPLTDLQGYKVHYGSSSGDYSVTVDVGNVTSFTITNLEPGTYFVAVTAYNASGIESDYSNEGSKTIL